MLTDNVTVRYAEKSRDNSVPVWILQNFVQQTAAVDAHAMSAGWEELSKAGVAWVLIKIQFEIFSNLQNVSEIKIQTRHILSDKIKSRRDFIIFDDKGNSAAKIISWWLILDLETKKIIRTPSALLGNKSESLADIQEFALKEPEYKELTPVKELKILTRLEDMDLNGHVNNTHFTAWAVESVPEGIRQNKTLKDLTINFKNEAKAGEKIIVKTYQEKETSFWHILVRDSDSKEIAAVYTNWL